MIQVEIVDAGYVGFDIEAGGLRGMDDIYVLGTFGRGMIDLAFSNKSILDMHMTS